MKLKALELKRRIELLGYTQQEFASKCGLTRQALSSWLTGERNAKSANIKKMADFLGCDITDIAIPESPIENVALHGDKFAEAVISTQEPHIAPAPAPDTIRNTPELRECIKDAMLREGVRDAAELNRLIGYDSAHTLERLLAGKLNWFPDVLSAVLEALHIDHDDVPVTTAERMLLLPDGFFDNGAMLIRPLPIVDWANAASHLSAIVGGNGSPVMKKWNPDTTETIAVPVGVRRETQAFRVSGLSMEPTINDNDIILAERRNSFDDVSDKKVVVVKFADCGKYSESIVCKRLRKFGRQLTLTSDNPNGLDFEIEPGDVEWLGVVVQFLSNRGL